MFKNKFFLGILALIFIAGGLIVYQKSTEGDQIADNFDQEGKVVCINPSLPIPASIHWHQNLSIVINGEKAVIPPDVGIEPGCHRVLHTHDDSGEIHIEPNKPEIFYLGDFFGVWGKEFNSNQILDKKVDSNHELIMTVNGIPSDQYENLVLEDAQQIKIEYKSK